MTDEPQKPEPSLNISGLIIDTWKTKHPSLFSAFPPPDFMPFIGLVVISWGMFEVIFDNFLAALTKANGYLPDWRGQAFRRRRTLFEAQAVIQFAASPDIVNYLRAILADTHAIYPKRNLVVHGQIAISWDFATNNGITAPLPKIECSGRVRGREIRETFTKIQIEDLYYEISHLSGRLNHVSVAGPAPGFSSRDISLLQAFLVSNHPTYPNPSMLPPPLKASAP